MTKETIPYPVSSTQKTGKRTGRHAEEFVRKRGACRGIANPIQFCGSSAIAVDRVAPELNVPYDSNTQKIYGFRLLRAILTVIRRNAQLRL